MPLGDSNFFESMASLMGNGETDFFTNTDIKTILGKNVVKNMLCKVNFEIQTLGYSDTANNIAEFYETCKNTSGIIAFFNNPVMKMILEEIQYMPNVKRYLNDRIFSYIEDDKIKQLNKTFDNNEEIYNKQQQDINEFKKQQILRERKIKQIMKEKKCTKEQAENILKETENAEETKKMLQCMQQDFKQFLGSSAINKAIEDDLKDKITDILDNARENTVIELDDEQTDITNSDDNGFWNI